MEDINVAAQAIEAFLQGYGGVVSAQVHPSGDDVDVIKVWIDLGASAADPAAFAKACEEAIRSAVPATSGYRLEVRAERD